MKTFKVNAKFRKPFHTNETRQYAIIKARSFDDAKRKAVETGVTEAKLTSIERLDNVIVWKDA